MGTGTAGNKAGMRAKGRKEVTAPEPELSPSPLLISLHLNSPLAAQSAFPSS